MSGLSAKYGARGHAGAQGEKYWANLVKRAGFDKFEVYYSLSMPRRPGQTHLATDIDCVIANGNRVVLIDVKRWRGLFLWTLSLRDLKIPIDVLRPRVMEGKWTLSKNMHAALDLVRYHLPEAEVSAMVVFVPTKDNDPGSVPFEVAFLKWPGDIKSYLAADGATEVKRRLGDEVEEVRPQIRHLLTRLTRK